MSDQRGIGTRRTYMEKNENGMIVTILGSGTGVPSLRRSSCSTLVETGPMKMVFDLGPGTIRRLLEAGVTVSDLTHVVFTHFHPDHCSELVPLLFALKAPGMRDIGHKLTIIGGTGLVGLYEGLKGVFGHWIDLTDGLDIIELDVAGEHRLDLDGRTLFALPVRHNRESLAFRLEVRGRSLVISGDTDTCDNLVRIAEKADLLICESATPDEDKREGHLTPSLAGRIATEAAVKKLVLTHFYPECDKTDIAKQCFKTYDGPLFKAEDLMRFYL